MPEMLVNPEGLSSKEEMKGRRKKKPSKERLKKEDYEPEVVPETAVLDASASAQDGAVHEVIPKEEKEPFNHEVEKVFSSRYVAEGGDLNKLTEDRVKKIKSGLREVPNAAKEVSSFLRGEVRRGADVTLGNVVENSVVEYLKNVAMTHPEFVAKLAPAIEELEKFPAAIAEKEREIDEKLKHLPDYHALTEKRNRFVEEVSVSGQRHAEDMQKTGRRVRAYERLKERASGVARFAMGLKDKLFGKPASVRHAENELVEKQKDWKEEVAVLESGLENVEKNIATYDQADALKASLREGFNDYRQQIFDTIEPAQELSMRATDAAEKRLLGFIGKGSVESLQQAQEYLNYLRTQDTGLDFLQNMDSEKIQQEIDYLVAGAVNTELDAQIEKAFAMLDFDPSGEGVYGDLEKAVEPYLGLEKIGSKNAKRTKKFFANILRSKIDELDKPEDEVKRLLLQKLVAKHGLFENKVAFIRGKNGEGVWQKE